MTNGYFQENVAESWVKRKEKTELAPRGMTIQEVEGELPKGFFERQNAGQPRWGRYGMGARKTCRHPDTRTPKKRVEVGWMCSEGISVRKGGTFRKYERDSHSCWKSIFVYHSAMQMYAGMSMHADRILPWLQADAKRKAVQTDAATRLDPSGMQPRRQSKRTKCSDTGLYLISRSRCFHHTTPEPQQACLVHDDLVRVWWPIR